MAAMVDPCILHPFRAPGTAEPPQCTLSDFTAYFTTFLRKKIHPPRGFSTSSKMFVEKEIENGGYFLFVLNTLVLNFTA
ncbi:hypothetical protein [Faecalibacterium prausnitzii]|uniref:hypothetical protein n=1 Tax=Faecalibacterium prausnitzii TaxID=853 RepID=UPI00117A4977|nr:hypothetical protein [Faecalibacterium prausnitzii]